ncbi:MAG: AMP-binding protein [Acidimicrobiia bacterium]
MGSDELFRSVPAMVRASATRFGSRVAIIDGDERLTFTDVDRQMREVAKALIASGVEKGDRVAVWAPNSWRWIVAALGTLATGAWLVPVNTRFKGHEAAFSLGKTDAKVLFTVGDFVGNDYVAMLQHEDQSLSALKNVVFVDDSARDGVVSWADFITRGAAIDDAVVDERIAAISPDDVSDVIFTSGTTGMPKGVMLRHGASMKAFIDHYNVGFELHEGDVALILSPFFHCFGYKAGWMLALAVGATSIPVAVFDPEKAMADVVEHGVTHLAGAPTFFVAMLNHPNRDKYHFTTVRKGLMSAAYVPAELFHRIVDEMGMQSAITGYGLTEAHALGSVSMPGDDPDYTAAWSGKVIPEIEVRIVDDEGNDVPLGERGELLIRGYVVMTGYYGDPEATASVIDTDGWLHTGDIAYMNDRGYIKIADRKKDMYIMGGFNVAPAEVEGVLTEWDKIAQAAVIGVPDDHFGEVGMAFVIPRVGVTLTPEEVVDYARSKLANFKVPRKVEIVDSLPLNATGKVLKNDLRARA